MMMFRYSNICQISNASSIPRVSLESVEFPYLFSSFLLVLREVIIIIIIIIRGIGREKKERKKGKGKEKGEKKKEKKRKKDNEDSRVGNKIVTSSKELFPCVSHGLRRVS